MLIQHIGHAEFLLETESGVLIATDPYDESCGYPVRSVGTDIALISHGHHDHNATENLSGNFRVLDQAGIYQPEPDVRITAIRGFHDDVKGAKRGETLLFMIETEDLRVVHLGDLGCMVDDEQIRILRNPDVLMIPVGGFYTIDGKQARQVAASLNPRVILPMHYRTKYNADWPISGPEDFLEGYSETDIFRDAEALRVTAGDMECQPKVVLFKTE